MSVNRYGSLIQRAEFLLQHLHGESSDQIHRPSESSQTTHDLSACLIEVFRRSSGPDVEAHFAISLYLVLYARYPRLSEIAQLRFALKTCSVEDLIKRHLASKPFQAFLPGSHRYKLVMADPKLLYIDVTHTSTYAFNSGIQRVVRCLVSELLRQKRPISLLYMADKDSRPVRLPEDEIEKLTHWEKHQRPTTIFTDSKQRSRLISRFFKSFVRQIAAFSVEFPLHVIHWTVNYLLGFSNIGRSWSDWLGKVFEPIILKWTRIVYSRPADAVPNKTGEFFEVLVFGNDKQKFLIPELPIGRYVDFYLTAKSHLPVQYSIILYDLIPVLNPEFCASALKLAFLDYLRLYRVVDRVSCISHDVARQIRHFLPNQNRSSEGLVETHYLGCNVTLDNESSKKDITTAPEDLPIVLCVGTFEPRKNGITLLRAAILAQNQGLRFKLVFAGNPGWLVEEFLAECDTAVRTGYSVECLGHVSEDKLKSLYRSCHFTVFCSLQEGFGLPIVESLYFGKPCIVSNIGCMKEISSSGGCLPLNDPNSFDELAEALKKLLNDASLYDKLRSEALAFKWPSWGDYASKVYEFSV